MSYQTLAEALMYGTGTERAFICPAHDDHDASASVNSLTGLFVCYACGWKGKVGPEHLEPTVEGVHRLTQQVIEDLEPKQRYSEAWLNAFDSTGPGDYWLSRFDADTCRHFRLGHAEGLAIYPMRDNGGRVMGVVSRDLTGSREQKYMYPSGVRNSHFLIDYHRVSSPIVLLVEGMTDVCAVWQAGFEAALGCYRAWLSDVQVGLLRRYAPSTVLVAYDTDEAGQRGYKRVKEALADLCPVHRLWWTDYKDLAEIPLSERRDMLADVLSTQQV